MDLINELTSFPTEIISLVFFCHLLIFQNQLFILRRVGRDIVLASFVHSIHTFCLSGTISQYLSVRFDSFLVQMISTMDSRYPISLVKMDPLTLELLPLF